MSTAVVVALLSGGFTLLGVLGGALLTAGLGRSAARRQLRDADARRWLADRRVAYAKFLSLAESMLQEVDGLAMLLSYDGTQVVTDEDAALLADGISDYLFRWENEVAEILGDVQLLARPPVMDLADRVSGALIEVLGPIEQRQSFVSYYPGWFQAKDLVQVLRDSMRQELGLEASSVTSYEERRRNDWPWLPDRPPRESYVQSPYPSD